MRGLEYHTVFLFAFFSPRKVITSDLGLPWLFLRKPESDVAYDLRQSHESLYRRIRTFI